MQEPYRKGSSESILISSLAGDIARCFLKRRQRHRWAAGSFCFYRLGGALVSWRSSRLEFCRNRALNRVSGLGKWLFLFHVASLHRYRAVCAPALARHAHLLEPLAGRRHSGSLSGTRCACRGSCSGVYRRGWKSVVVYSLLAQPSPDPTVF